MGCWVEVNRDESIFSPHFIKGTCCQPDSLLWILISSPGQGCVGQVSALPFKSYIFPSFLYTSLWKQISKYSPHVKGDEEGNSTALIGVVSTWTFWNYRISFSLGNLCLPKDEGQVAVFPQITLEWPPSQHGSCMKRDISFNHYLGFEDMNNGTLESFEDGRRICNKEKLVADTRRQSRVLLGLIVIKLRIFFPEKYYWNKLRYKRLRQA